MNPTDSHVTPPSMINSFIPYAKQSLNDDDFNAVVSSLKEDVITRGQKVEEFEREMALYCGAQYAVAFHSGSSALMGACYAANLNSFDSVLTTPNTFVATVGSPIQFGATPILMDIDPTSGNLCLNQLGINLKSKMSRGKKVVIPVHFAGVPVDMQKLDSLVSDPETIVIEDAAHAIGSRYLDGQRVGSCAWSHMTIFSFHPSKTMTTTEGGMVLTNDAELSHRLRLFRNNGIERDFHYWKEGAGPWYYEVNDLSCNYNFTEIQAALGISQLKRLDQFVMKRRQLMQRYRDCLSEVPHLQFFSQEYDARTAYHLCVVQIDFSSYKMTRADLMQKLKDQGIGTQVHYIPIYRHPFFRKKRDDLNQYFPQMESYYSKALSMPLYYDLDLDEVDRVCAVLKKILNLT